MTHPADELTGTVVVKVAGDDIEVPRPPFRRLQPLLELPQMAALLNLEATGDGEVGGEVAIAALIPMGNALGEVLFGETADEYLDRIFKPSDFAEFIGSAIDALQLGEVLASADS